jgi:hypothetical protein
LSKCKYCIPTENGEFFCNAYCKNLFLNFLFFTAKKLIVLCYQKNISLRILTPYLIFNLHSCREFLSEISKTSEYSGIFLKYQEHTVIFAEFPENVQEFQKVCKNFRTLQEIIDSRYSIFRRALIFQQFETHFFTKIHKGTFFFKINFLL